ncbi:ATP-binding cassette domain-containing protein [Bradyrhizobium sp. USDA 10063]
MPICAGGDFFAGVSACLPIRTPIFDDLGTDLRVRVVLRAQNRVVLIIRPSRSYSGPTPSRPSATSTSGLRPANWVCIVGPSGCGKSTLLGGLAEPLQVTRGSLPWTISRSGSEPGSRKSRFSSTRCFPGKRVRECRVRTKDARHRQRAAGQCFLTADLRAMPPIRF